MQYLHLHQVKKNEKKGIKSIAQSLCLHFGHSLLQEIIQDFLFFNLSIITDEKLQNKVQIIKIYM